MPGRFAILPSSLVADRRIGDAAFRVLAALSTYADRDGWCWPSQQTLASDVGTSRRSVRTQLDVLEEAGYVESSRRIRADGSESSKTYRLLYDRDHWRPTRQSPPASETPTPGVLRASDRRPTRHERSHPNDPIEQQEDGLITDRTQIFRRLTGRRA